MNLINNQQKLNDLIFANRNKNYGAYAIRSAYGNTMLKSLSCMIFGFSTFIGIAYYLSERPEVTDIPVEQIPVEKIYSIPFDTEKEKKPEVSKATPPGKTRENKINTANANIIKSDSLIAETSTLTNESMQSVVSNSTGDAIPGESSPENSGKGTGKHASGTNTTVVKGNFEVDSQPEFEGGLAALYRFVSSHLKYPVRALDEGVQGTVFVKFVVDEKGRVGSLSLQNNLGYGLDDEAKRVVGMIPNFKTPAMVNGEAVQVYYQLPIKFKYK